MTGSPPHPFREPIEPLPPAGDRPLWSVMIPSFNCSAYLRDALASVLAQDPGAGTMQIEVVDDASSDDPQAVVEELGGDRVGFYRQPENVGHVRNFNTCLRRARGQIVHLLHGDDAVRPGFYRTLETAFERPEIGAAFCRYISVDARGNWQTIAPLERDSSGILENWLEQIALGQRLQTPCMVVRRTVYEQLGGFDRRLTHSEDWEMWTRIAAHFPVWYEAEPLALYRIHGASSSDRSRSAGENVVDLRRTIAINRDLLPPKSAADLTARALAITATTAIRRAGRMLRAGNEGAARAQVREALRTSRAFPVFEHLLFFVVLWLRERLFRHRRGDR